MSQKDRQAQGVQNTQFGERKLQKTNGLQDTYCFVPTMQMMFSEISETEGYFFLNFQNILRFNVVNTEHGIVNWRSGPDFRIN